MTKRQSQESVKKSNQKSGRNRRNSKTPVYQPSQKNVVRGRKTVKAVTKSKSGSVETPRTEPKARMEKRREKEPEKESDGSPLLAAINGSAETKKLEVQTQEVDVDKMKKLLVKLKADKLKPRMAPVPLDAKAKLLMDRVMKKPYPMRYETKGKEELLCFDETSSFYRPSKELKKFGSSVRLTEDSYEYVPKLAVVRRLPQTNVFNPNGVPFWADRLEPTDDEIKDIDPPISVGSDHVELYHDQKLPLKSIANAKVVLDVFQPLVCLQKRDEVHFHAHLVFSNTVRSLVNVQSGGTSDPNRTRPNVDESDRQTRILAGAPHVHFYSRTFPIQSARESKEKTGSGKTLTKTTSDL
ncbi:unnamed protein product [Caenorhabditis sp. 36 PRJEB53466]|nr:unnamed protein product [Caenorhabditis sp. 36 PRJEB53466]